MIYNEILYNVPDIYTHISKHIIYIIYIHPYLNIYMYIHTHIEE